MSRVALWSVGLAVAVFAASAWLTGWFRRYALAHQLVDVPNARSSHTEVTPRGGGAAIVLTMLAALPVLGLLGALSWPDVYGLAGGGLIVAVVGYVDDRGQLPARWRLLGHFTGAAWVLWWLGGLPPLAIPGFTLEPGRLSMVLAALYLVWLLNLTNFMDGIDGIAALETITVCLGALLLHAVASPSGGLWIPPAVLMVAAAAFLVWNWPPARIFMGDAGSGFVGLSLGGALTPGGTGGAPTLLGLGDSARRVHRGRDRDAAAAPGAPGAGVRGPPGFLAREQQQSPDAARLDSAGECR